MFLPGMMGEMVVVMLGVMEPQPPSDLDGMVKMFKQFEILETSLVERARGLAEMREQLVLGLW